MVQTTAVISGLLISFCTALPKHYGHFSSLENCFSSTWYSFVMRELLRSLGSDHSQPCELDAKAQPQSGVLSSRQTVTDNLALYYHKQMVISSNRMIMPNTIFNLWASPTNKSITTPSWDHYTASFPSALFAQYYCSVSSLNSSDLERNNRNSYFESRPPMYPFIHHS